jgi:hypothetical protein
MKNSITLDVDHYDKERVEYFLNSVEETLEQIPLDAQELNHMRDIIAAFKFKVKSRPIFVIVIFATSYFHAEEIRKANSVVKPATDWTINGSILFGVESEDKDMSDDLLSLFAGRE